MFQVLPYPALPQDVQFVEGLGVDAVWLADQAVPPELPIMEAWTTLAALAAQIERVRIGTLVTNITIRNPMLLARQALTVDQVSAGRLQLGIGSGYYAEDHRRVGIDILDGRGRMQRLTEAAEFSAAHCAGSA